MATKALPHKRLDIYKHSDEIVFLMELLKVSYVSCNKIYPSNREYRLFLACGRASDTVSQEEFDMIINKAKFFREKFYEFIKIEPSDTIHYRRLMSDFMSNSGVRSLRYSHIDFKVCRYSTIKNIYNHLCNIRLKLEDLFLDNNIHF